MKIKSAGEGFGFRDQVYKNLVLTVAMLIANLLFFVAFMPLLSINVNWLASYVLLSFVYSWYAFEHRF